MKLTIPSKLLLAALATIKPIAKPSTTHPIIGNVAISANKESVTLMGMDLEKQLVITLPCKVKEQGSTTMPCNRLHDWLSEVGSPECTIDTTKNHESTIRAGTAVCKILGMAVEDMPPSISVGEGEGIMIDAKVFNSFMAKSLLHAHDQKERAILCSVELLSRNGKLNIQATNGQHAIMCATELGFEESTHFIVPRESVPALIAVATEGELELLFGENVLSVKTETCAFATKLIEGNPPNYDAVFPKELPLKITANRQELERIVRIAEKGTSEQASLIILSCDGSKLAAKGAVAVIVTGNEGFFDMSEDYVKVKKGSAVIDVKCKPDYMRDALKCLEQDEVSIEFDENPRVVVMREPGVLIMICLMRLE